LASVSDTQGYTSLTGAISETIKLGDAISDVVMQIRLDLSESIGVSTSFLTDAAAVHSEPAADNVAIGDEMTITGDYHLELRESLGASLQTASTSYGRAPQPIELNSTIPASPPGQIVPV